ncbi:hypothetical protein B0H34DRAFT_480644 [Crassisporium funariophilum]|nr:hypothetical protein B0H34DRAFT_480644 [Crassisporium funariophilum]
MEVNFLRYDVRSIKDHLVSQSPLLAFGLQHSFFASRPKRHVPGALPSSVKTNLNVTTTLFSNRCPLPLLPRRNSISHKKDYPTNRPWAASRKDAVTPTVSHVPLHFSQVYPSSSVHYLPRDKPEVVTNTVQSKLNFLKIWAGRTWGLDEVMFSRVDGEGRRDIRH